MNPNAGWCGGTGPWLALCLISLGLRSPLAAQSRLYVLDSDKKYHLVVKVVGHQPMIQEGGKITTANGDQYALVKTDEYVPLYVAVINEHTTTAATAASSVGLPVMSEFHFSAGLEASYALDNVFLVVEAEFSNVGKSTLVREVGRLKPWAPKQIAETLPMERNLTLIRRTVHVFVDGAEVFNSEISAAEREQSLDAMVARRIVGLADGPPKLLFGSAPEYPRELARSGLKGKVILALTVTAGGKVTDQSVISASEPAFGEAALNAVRPWRFIPRMHEGRAMATRVQLPFLFDPPATQAAGS